MLMREMYPSLVYQQRDYLEIWLFTLVRISKINCEDIPCLKFDTWKVYKYGDSTSNVYKPIYKGSFTFIKR